MVKVKLPAGSGGPYNTAICRVCDALTDDSLIVALITEARRHEATGAKTGDFGQALARIELS